MTPCPEAGLAFRRGDVLHIVNQEDPYWWQARREGDKNMRAGIIPGRQLQERCVCVGGDSTIMSSHEQPLSSASVYNKQARY